MSASEQTQRSPLWARTATVVFLAMVAVLATMIPVRSAVAPTLERPAASAPEEPEAIPLFGPP